MEWNYTNMQTACGSNFVTGIYPNGTFICGTVQQASEIDPYGLLITQLLTRAGVILTMQQQCFTCKFNNFKQYLYYNLVTSNNASMNSYILSNNQSVTNAINSVAAAGEPLWTQNVSIFNASWLATYNATVNASINNYILANNGSVNNYILSNNQSVTNAINSVAAAGEPLWTQNASLFNASWLATYNATVNASINNYILANNGSVNNYILSNNQSVTNAINSVAAAGEPLGHRMFNL